MPAYYLEAFTVILGIVLLMIEAFGPSHSKKAVGISAAAGLAAILVLLFFAKGPSEEAAFAPIWQNFYQFDGLARFYKGFALVCTALVILMSIDFRSVLSRFTDHPESESGTGEFYALPVFACAGMMWMASAKDLAGAFVALELVTITFYILVAYMRRNVGSLEAGVKYLILGALSTGFLVYGIAWIYGATGTMNLAEIGAKLGGLESTTPLLFGVGLILVALGFKIGAVPMQVWIPDVYQGAPTPTTAFLSVGSKAAGFILLIRFLTPIMENGSEIVVNSVKIMLLVMAGATVIFGNFAAIAQSNFKRLLAYSSIAHAGFLILALAAWTKGDAEELGSVGAVSFYLATYLLMTLASFFVLAQIKVQKDSEMIDAFDGLGKRSPMLAVAMTIIMAALAGIPLTAGFWGKFFVFLLAAQAGLWWGVILAAVGATAGFYYYFKLIRSMWWNEPSEASKPFQMPKISSYCVGILTAAVVILGIWPQPILWLLGSH
ncbi:NADH-quinone oxidoreductase subunit N [Haloferula chungangensis]|uniref:NADH-quinone oxidoreductase subunit N n=1 Tax=Haloferula chungangensis TaxID=1048331 RepID=A0ABW2L4E2_9BACT